MNITQTNAWQALASHRQNVSSINLTSLFDEDPDRFKDFNLQIGDILFDFSKNHLKRETINLLIDLASEIKITEKIDAMFRGEKINYTENRAVLHTALRNFGSEEIVVDGVDIMPQIRQVREQMKEFSHKIRSGEWRGYSGKQIRTVINIGIGGSDLGPAMVTKALTNFVTPEISFHFVSNVDASDLNEALKHSDPETTLFLVASKTFTTQETMLNAETAKLWLLARATDHNAVAKHFVALSTNKEAVQEFGIDPSNMFEFWDYVGGRYSLWSAIGLSIAIAVGYDRFEELLKGAEEVDKHFRNSPLKENIPVIMALIGIWYNNFWHAQSHAILPYSKYLERFAAYLQQGDMESNGKSVNKDGEEIKDYSTGPIIWGEPGTNGQHAFYQLIHQGTKLIPCDFIGVAQPFFSADNVIPPEQLQKHHQILFANFLAQTEALMRGDQTPEPYKVMPGNRPTNSFILKELNPTTLGGLIALYEHKIFVQGQIWQINSFDQWGVQLGKKLAANILDEIESGKALQHDNSTIGLITAYGKFKKS